MLILVNYWSKISWWWLSSGPLGQWMADDGKDAKNPATPRKIEPSETTAEQLRPLLTRNLHRKCHRNHPAMQDNYQTSNLSAIYQPLLIIIKLINHNDLSTITEHFVLSKISNTYTWSILIPQVLWWCGSWGNKKKDSNAAPEPAEDGGGAGSADESATGVGLGKLETPGIGPGETPQVSQ